MAAKPAKTFYYTYNKQPTVKIAGSNLFLETAPMLTDKEMTSAIFEDIAGNEFINEENYAVFFNPQDSNVKNMPDILQTTSPKALFKSSNIFISTFAQFAIELLDKIPNVGNGSNNANIYYSSSKKSILVEFININDDEEIEIEFMGISSPISGTI